MSGFDSLHDKSACYSLRSYGCTLCVLQTIHFGNNILDDTIINQSNYPLFVIQTTEGRKTSC